MVLNGSRFDILYLFTLYFSAVMASVNYWKRAINKKNVNTTIIIIKPASKCLPVTEQAVCRYASYRGGRRGRGEGRGREERERGCFCFSQKT